MRLLIMNCIIALCFCGCIEPYEFTVKNNEPTLVVEGFISNVSFRESLTFPSDGRYFSIKLRYTSDVINTRDEVVKNGLVYLVSDSGEEWYYSESADVPGEYLLEDLDFRAVEGQAYKLKIILPDEAEYESEWQKLPPSIPENMGEMGFEEVEKQVFKYVAGEEVVQTIKGINVFIEIPPNENGSQTFYRWEFSPIWIYIAPLARSIDPDQKCWIEGTNYISNFALQIDNNGGYRKNLFFIETVNNERIYEGLSVLINQYALSENDFYFWNEMKDQIEGNGVFDSPPFNLKTNIKAMNDDEKVSGIFSVLDEKAKRWNFTHRDLSYTVTDDLLAECLVIYGPDGPAPVCLSCLEYEDGEPTLKKPVWWVD